MVAARSASSAASEATKYSSRTSWAAVATAAVATTRPWCRAPRAASYTAWEVKAR